MPVTGQDSYRGQTENEKVILWKKDWRVMKTVFHKDIHVIKRSINQLQNTDGKTRQVIFGDRSIAAYDKESYINKNLYPFSPKLLY